jgi:hypothetical protein
MPVLETPNLAEGEKGRTNLRPIVMRCSFAGNFNVSTVLFSRQIPKSLMEIVRIS